MEEGQKALVFSQFTSMLDLVAWRLRVDGIGSARLGATREDMVLGADAYVEGQGDTGDDTYCFGHNKLKFSNLGALWTCKGHGRET